ncbi:MAG: 2-oxoacid:ferredoxin oxidoreductase subunit beta [Frankia sp.]|nr:2-oxoacid:ferredoxin oxidoreductase subunit beta [Frankia sp.]
MTSTDFDFDLPALRSVPRTAEPLSAAEFRTSQEVRWCPGCGDHAILAAAQGFLASLRIPRENIVIVSGIGCSSRLPYYVDTYGIHSIHGRAPTIATGISINRPDLSVWVVTGDGDALSIGGNHLIHALRRNVNLKILLLNNRIYGLTKGQYSPTSEFGKVTKSTPGGSLDDPFNPIALAIGAGASFVARTIDSDRRHLAATLGAAVAHDGTALVEIYQNCPVFNNDAYQPLKDPSRKDDWTIRLEHGQPVIFGSRSDQAVVRDPVTGALRIGSADDPDVVVHDARTDNPAYALALSLLAEKDLRHTPIGVFRSVFRPTYDSRFRAQLAEAEETGPTDLQQLLLGTDNWTIG